jgi:microcompartment protein CcmK/EutM
MLATQVDELSAMPFLWVQPLDRDGRADGEPLVCADPTRMAGPGQVIYWVASRAGLRSVVRPGRRRHRRPGRRGAELCAGGTCQGGRGIVILARITGSVVSTTHHPIVDGHKLLLAERLDATGKPAGGYLIAVDAIGAGRGETVLILDEGNGARQILEDDDAPVRSMVVGIVDEVELAPS